MHALSALQCALEGAAHDALDLVFAVLHRVIRILAQRSTWARSRNIVDPVALAEVQAADKLAHDEHIRTAHYVGLQRRCTDKLVVCTHGAQIGIQAELFADGEKALFGTRVIGISGLPFWTAHRSKQHGISRARCLERFCRKRGAQRIDGCAADKRLTTCKRHTEALGDTVEHLLRLTHDFRPDTITRQQAYVHRRAHR